MPSVEKTGEAVWIVVERSLLVYPGALRIKDDMNENIISTALKIFVSRIRFITSSVMYPFNCGDFVRINSQSEGC